MRWCFVFSPHRSSASALLAKEETEKTVHFCIVHATQLNCCSARAERIDYKIYGVIQQRMNRESQTLEKSSSDWLNSGSALIQAFEWKMQFSCFPVLPGSAEAYVIWGGIVKHLLIMYLYTAAKSSHCRELITGQWLDYDGLWVVESCVTSQCLTLPTLPV